MNPASSPAGRVGRFGLGARAARDCVVRIGGASTPVVVYDNPICYDFVLTHGYHTMQQPEKQQWSFWVDEFDFPLIAYTRLSASERFAVVLLGYDAQQRSAEFSLVFFPRSRGGARDRPFIDSVIQTLTDPPRETAVGKEAVK